ncbi:MAG: hypothetical protein OEY56_10350, partial [Cyclobacteriaceae bacterium]|nr:hypothetical protein [Cyclobacteriaceae bacterium]
MRGNIFLLTVLLLQSVWVPAQETRVSNGFIQDSLSVGEPVDFWLAITYPDQMEALFPDSTSTAFAPFEYMGKTYFPTRVLPGEQAYDSIVYRLQSFEIDAVQYLQLPVYLFDRRDSTTRLSGLDSIVFRDL